MMDRIEEEVIRYLFLLQPVTEQELPERRQRALTYQQPQQAAALGQGQRMKEARSLIPSKKRRR
jgi:hypothetical protein